MISTGIDRGLLGPREAGRIWNRHIINCAVMTSLVRPGARLCDIGSGAGLPGVVIALARPDVHVTLLEPLLRRVTFLEEVVAALDLDNVDVLRGRAEEIRPEALFDVVTARALAPLERLAGWALPLLRVGGEVLAIKGESAADEVAAASDALTRLGARRIVIESCGLGIADSVTTVVRIESSGKLRRTAKGV